MRTLLRAITAGGGLFLGWAGFAAESETPQTLPAETLTNAAQIRNLTYLQAQQAMPATLSGIVIDKNYVGTNWETVILQDPTAAVYAIGPRNTFSNCSAGDRVEVKGVTDPGGFAPIVQAQSSRKTGQARVPDPQPVTYQQLITGAMDGQWVEISGVVRVCFDPAPGADAWRIVVAMDGGLVPVRYATPSGGKMEVDAEVKVRAVVFYQFNQKRQVLHPVLQVPRTASLVVMKPAPANPYTAPVRSAASLSMFMPENFHDYAHRVHVRGVVTHAEPDSAVWIRDGASGLRIQTHQQGQLVPGDKIDVLGFPTFGGYSPVLEDAVLIKTGSSALPTPLVLTNFNDAFDHEDDLVSIDGLLTQIQPVLDGAVLTVDKDGKTFKASVKVLPGPPEWQPGSKVRLRGICSLVHDEDRPFAGIWQPKSFELLLRSGADLTVLEPPSWWTRKHVTVLLGVVTGVLLLTIGVVVAVSHRRLNEQERQRQMAENEFAAILAERNRLAREIHDTLAQGLGAISMQLELTKARLATGSESTGEHLAQAHQLVRNSLADARNSIWNMRSQVLETGNLASALTDILKQLCTDTGVTGQVRVKGRARRLPPVTENNLLRIGQEAITNAMKHASAKAIEVELEYADKEVRLRVRDDGRGFDMANPPASDSGFGLLGMRERAEELHGRLDIRSEAGRGTEITLAVPLAG